MKKITASAAILLAAASFALGGSGDSSNVTDAQQRGPSGEFIIDRSWAIGNPALAGLESRGQNRLSLFPTSVSIWNDKIALPFGVPTSGYLTSLMRESFGLRGGLSPDEVSDKLTDKLGGGITLYGAAQSTPVDFSAPGLGFNVRMYGGADAKIPGGLFKLFFSETDGLLAGNTLDLSDTRVSALWATEIGFRLGRGLDVPFIADFLSLDEGAVGAGVKLLYGHYYYSVEARENSAFSYDTLSNKYKMDAGFDVLKAEGGYGLGFDFGAVFRNGSHAVSIDVQDIGFIRWDGANALRGTTSSGEIDLDNLDFADFVKAKVRPGESYVLWLPTSLNAGYAYFLDMTSIYGYGFGLTMSYLAASLTYNQQLALGPGKNTYTPRFIGGAKLGFLRGYLPLRYGITAGGTEKIASTVGIGFDGKHRSADLSFKAVGSPILIPKKGFEISFSQTSLWGGGKAKGRHEKAPPAVQAAPVDTAPAPPEVQEAPVDTLTAPPVTLEELIDTSAAPPEIPEEPVDSTAVPPEVQEAPADTLTVPPEVQEVPADTLTVPPAIHEAPVGPPPAPHGVNEAPAVHPPVPHGGQGVPAVPAPAPHGGQGAPAVPAPAPHGGQGAPEIPAPAAPHGGQGTPAVPAPAPREGR
ncbi:hypothetical protein R80B4_00497 [Fibrobacteres bacterium R8-0-B4]